MSEGSDKDKIVPSTPSGLSTRSSVLVQRGLQDLAVSAPKVGKRILVADDQEAINEVIGQILSAAGYEVRTTSRSSEVVALVAAFQPQVALIGLIAPEIHGVDLSRELASRFPNLKIVLTGEEVSEALLRLVLNSGVACDTLDLPFDPKDMLEMMNTWVSGSDYIDPVTHLRDAKHFRMGLLGEIGADHFKSIGLVNYSKPSIIFIELFERAPSHMPLENERSFLRSVGTILARYARDGFAYRCGESQFAILLPRTTKDEAYSSSTWLMQELKSRLKDHDLSDHYFPAIGILSLPDDAQSTEQVEDAARQLIAQAKNAERGIALFEPFELNAKDTWTGLYTEPFFMEALHAEWKRSERNKRVFSLIDVHLGDLDALLGKSRDWLRPLVGQIGDTINATCRRSDAPCQYNLGEFLILLPETSLEGACSLAQQLHSNIKAAGAHVLAGRRPPLTISVATYPADGNTPVDLLRRLDEAMLILKNSTGDGVAAVSKGVLSPP